MFIGGFYFTAKYFFKVSQFFYSRLHEVTIFKNKLFTIFGVHLDKVKIFEESYLLL